MNAIIRAGTESGWAEGDRVPQERLAAPLEEGGESPSTSTLPAPAQAQKPAAGRWRRASAAR